MRLCLAVLLSLTLLFSNAWSVRGTATTAAEGVGAAAGSFPSVAAVPGPAIAAVPGPAIAAARLASPWQPLLGTLSAEPARVATQQTGDDATLETRQPEVQWAAAAAGDWQAVPSRQQVRVGDRVRTGVGAAARLVYFEGTATEIGASTGLLVQRLERSTDGNIVASLFQSVGTTISRVVQLVDPSARFEVETPAATALVRGTEPRVWVGADGTTRVANVPDGTGGIVGVQGKDPDGTTITLLPGEETEIVPGQPPSQPAPLAPLPGVSAGQAESVQAILQQEQLERQQRREQAQRVAQFQAAEAQAALVASQAELERLRRQEQGLLQGLLSQLTPSPTVLSGGPGAGGVPCATETMGAIYDRSREHLGASDAAVIAVRRYLIRTVQAFQRGEPLPHLVTDPAQNHFGHADTLAQLVPRDGDWHQHFPQLVT